MMPRVRADDYEDKKGGILDAAATLFATQGYSGSKMHDIAKACEVSKSMLYHYFARKEDVLFEILRQHLERILSTIHSYRGRADSDDIDNYFRGYIENYLQKSEHSRARHVVALHDRRYLDPEQQNKIIKLERRIVDEIVQLLQAINSAMSESELRAHALLLIGMINWVELWYRRSGKISPNELYSMVTQLFLHGFAKPQKVAGRAARR